jgi:hypothetical protein
LCRRIESDEWLSVAVGKRSSLAEILIIEKSSHIVTKRALSGVDPVGSGVGVAVDGAERDIRG